MKKYYYTSKLNSKKDALELFYSFQQWCKEHPFFLWEDLQIDKFQLRCYPEGYQLSWPWGWIKLQTKNLDKLLKALDYNAAGSLKNAKANKYLKTPF